MPIPKPNHTSCTHTVNAGVRRVLTRHWIDLEKTNFHSFRGIVRIAGEMRSINSNAVSTLDAARMQVLESEMMRVHGVTRIHFDLRNWRKNMSGQWELVNSARPEPSDPVQCAGERSRQKRRKPGDKPASASSGTIQDKLIPPELQN